MLAWFRDLTAKERSTMLACFGGWSLDALDVQVYSFVMPTIIGLWGMSSGQAGLIGTVTLLISSFGGWIAGALADRYGRVRMLQITIIWSRSLPSCAALPRISSNCSCCGRCTGLGLAANGPPAPS